MASLDERSHKNSMNRPSQCTNMPSRCTRIAGKRGRAQFSVFGMVFASLLAAQSAAAFVHLSSFTRQRSGRLHMSVTPTPSTSDNAVSYSLQKKHQSETYQTNLEINKLASDAQNNSTAAAAAQRLLQELPFPDTITYNGVLKALAKSQSLDGAQKAHELLETMEKVSKQQFLAHNECYNNANMTHYPLDQDAPQVRVDPNVRSYSIVMDAWSRRSGRVPHAAQHAHEVLKRLETLYGETGNLSHRPNTISYNTVIAAYAKDGGKAHQAELLLKKMGPLADIISYNSVLLAFARSGLPDAGERAEALLRDMPNKNTRSYTTVIEAWSRSHAFDENSAERANALLEEMQDLYEKTRDLAIRPNCISYTTTINAYASSKDPNKAQKAWNILQHMRNLSDSGHNHHAKPSIVTFNSVLNACATSMPAAHLRTRQMVHSLYKEIMENPELQADHFTYGTVLKACANVFCGEEDNDEFVRSVFEECCKAGQASFGVCYQLRQAASSELYRELIPDNAWNPVNGHFDIQDMPPQWTRNVRERKPRDLNGRNKSSRS